MAWIKTLEMQGFKSFANKTKLEFNRNLSVIIGPNGSGKSNITESILFVLGETSKKGMRAETLGQLVFNGGKSGKPAKFAKVAITIDNSEKELPLNTKEVIISRAVTRKGASTYRINGQRTTRAEVSNILRHINVKPDGFNIILQGAIARFVEQKPEERKALIEEISGISIFDDKKDKAVKELSKVNDKIKEASIVLKEKETHLKELLSDKKTAEEYIRLKRKKEKLEGQIVLKRKNETEKLIENLKKEIKNKNDEIAKFESQIEEINSNNRAIEENINDISAEVKKRGEKESIAIGKSIEDLRININSWENNIENLKNELKKMDLRNENISKEIKDAEIEIKNSHKTAKTLSSEIKVIQKKISKLSPGIDKTKRLKEVLNMQEKLEGIESKISKLTDRLEKAMKDKDRLEKQSKLEAELKRMRAKKMDIEKMLNKDRMIERQIKNKISEVDNYVDHLIKRVAKLEERKDMYKEMIDSGTKEILRMRDSGEVQGIYGTITEICNIPNKYSKAFRVAVGDNINTIIVDNVSIAKKCIKHLKENKLGVARFLPLSNIKNPKKISLHYPGTIDVASNIIGHDAKFQKAVQWIFGDTVIVEDLHNIHDSEHKIVSLDGDLLHNGIHTGGHRSEVIAFRDQEIEADYQNALADISKYKTYKEKILAEAEKINSRIESHVENITTVKNKLHNIEKEYSSIQDSYNSLGIDIGETKKNIASLEKERNKLQEQISELTKSLSTEEVESQELEIKKLEQRKNELTVELKTLQAKTNEVIIKDIEKMKKLKEDITKSKEEFREKINHTKVKIFAGKKELKELYKKQKEFENNLKFLRNKREKLKRNIEKNKDRLRSIEKRITLNNKDVEHLKMKKADVVGKLEGLKLQIKAFDEIIPARSSLEVLEKEYEELKRRIEGFGPVNMKALEKYVAIEEEFNLLNEKVSTLEEEQKKIHEMIDEIEGKKLDTFMKTFREISNKFSDTFKLLSEDGEAKLSLENKENPLEGGVNMVARPAGKKLSTLTALSGGEKTLVTLSFLFAIQEYQPAPFYIMDEIDSALDKTNSEKLAELIRAYSKRAQFIVISHNDELVSASDHLYGISMKENAVSQIISMKLPPREE